MNKFILKTLAALLGFYCAFQIFNKLSPWIGLLILILTVIFYIKYIFKLIKFK